MDRKNAEVFSPIRNLDEEKSKRRTDSFSKFLKGPDVFKQISANSADTENVDVNAQVKKNSSKKLNKAHQKKTSKSEMQKSGESLGSLNDSVFITSRGEISIPKKDKSENSSLASSRGENSVPKKDKSENSSLASKRNKDIAVNYITKRNDKLKKNQEDEVDSNQVRHDAHFDKKNSANLVKSSLQPQTTVVPVAPESKEIKKTDDPSSVRQRNPLSQIQSGVFEKLINDAVESRFDDIQQLLYSQHFDLQKTLYISMEKMEERHASEQATLFKVIEALLEENRSLRNAILACR